MDRSLAAPTASAATPSAATALFACFWWLAVERNPCAAALVIVCQKVRRADRFHLFARTRFGGAHAEHLDKGFIVHAVGQHDPSGLNLRPFFGDFQRTDGQGNRVHNRRRHTRAHRHGQERVVDAVAIWQTKGDVGRPAGRVHPQFLAQTPHQGKDLKARRAHGPDGHDQRVNNDIMGRNAEISRPFHDLLGDGKADVGVLGNPGVVVGNSDHRHVVFLDQRQDEFEPLFLAGNGVKEGPTLCRRQTVLQRTRHRAVDAERRVCHGLHTLHQFPHQRGFDKVVVGVTRVFGHFVGEHSAGVDVENGGPCGGLGNRVRLDPGKIAALQLFVQDLAPCGVDPLADDRKGLVKADDGGLGFGFDNGAGHVLGAPLGLF
mmetsp:Transcript_29628/g.58574  ORF Transcript_29628/g.58574 Transcript_29628/m.58574 type:complete len:375 (-) Transcript_29628:358-1482(-)